MQSTLDKCRFVYNKMLEGLQNQKKVDRSALQNSIPALKKEYSELNLVYSKVLQYECYRLFSNLKSLAQLKKNKRKIGRLRFKGKEWFKTFNYNQSGFKLISTGKRCQKLHLSKIGDIQIRAHRPVAGKVKQITIKKYPSGKWYASLSVQYGKEIPSKKSRTKQSVGIDLGLMNFVYDSDDNSTKHPKFMNVGLNRLQVLQQHLSKKKKGSINRKKQRIKVAIQHEKIVNQRNDFLHKLSRFYISSYDIIAVEALEIRGIIKKTYNSRNIHDASWSKFLQMLEYKAESAGIQLVKIDPRGTSKICSSCEEDVPKKLWDRIHKCNHCGLTLDRDYNAAINILKKGLRKIGQELSEFKPAGEGTDTDIKINRQVPLMNKETMAFRSR